MWPSEDCSTACAGVIPGMPAVASAAAAVAMAATCDFSDARTMRPSKDHLDMVGFQIFLRREMDEFGERVLREHASVVKRLSKLERENSELRSMLGCGRSCAQKEGGDSFPSHGRGDTFSGHTLVVGQFPKAPAAESRDDDTCAVSLDQTSHLSSSSARPKVLTARRWSNRSKVSDDTSEGKGSDRFSIGFASRGSTLPVPKPVAAPSRRSSVSSVITSLTAIPKLVFRRPSSKQVLPHSDDGIQKQQQQHEQDNCLDPESEQETQPHGEHDQEDRVRFAKLAVWNSSSPSSITRNFRSVKSAVPLRPADTDEEYDPAGMAWELYARKCILEPNSRFSVVWTLIVHVFVLYDVVATPMDISFYALDLTWSRRWMLRVSPCFWTADMFVSMLTGYITGHGLIVEMRPRFVIAQYFRTRFAVDLTILVSEVCASMMKKPHRGLSTLLGLMHSLRLFRFIRFAHLAWNMDKLTEAINCSERDLLILYIVALMVTFLLLVHILACLWHGLRFLGPSPAAQPDIRGDYATAFTVCLLMLFGEHSQEPTTSWQTAFDILVLCFAFVLSAAVVGSLTTAMTRLQIIAGQQSAQFALLARYLSDHDISRELTLRVKRNVRHALRERRKQIPEASVALMSLVSKPLRAEIRYEMHMPIINEYPFLHMFNMFNPSTTRHVCLSAMSPLLVSKDDVVFSVMEISMTPAMLFVVSGEIFYMRGDDILLQSVFPGEWLAEGSLWTEWTHCGTARGRDEVQLLALDAAKFGHLVNAVPGSHGVAYAQQFIQHLNKLVEDDMLSDIGRPDQEAWELVDRVFEQKTFDRHRSTTTSLRSRSINRSTCSSRSTSAWTLG